MDLRGNADKDLLIAYLFDAGEIDPEGDVEAQFLDWHRVREGTVYEEMHYQVVLDAARVRVKNFEEGRKAGLAEGAAMLGWDELETSPGFTASLTMSTGRRVNIPDPAQKSRWRPLTGADRPVLCPEDLRAIPREPARLWPFWKQRTGPA